jgi:hypothetical protein
MTQSTKPWSQWFGGWGKPAIPGDAEVVDSLDAPELDPEAGLATAEYAVATIGAVAFAGLLILVLRSDTIKGLLESMFTSALSGF